MPASWNSLRIKEPVKGARTRWLFLGRGIAAIRQEIGPGPTWETQALRFNVTSPHASEADARSWAAAHGYGRGTVWTPAGAAHNPEAAPAPKRSRKAKGEGESKARARVKGEGEGKAKAKRTATAKAERKEFPLIARARRPVEPLPALAGLAGERGTLILPGAETRGWTKLPIRWAVVEAHKLIPSHVAGRWTPHPGYPAGVQERDYGPGTGERRKVELQVASFAPELLNSDAPTATDGPPVITGRGIVLGGNSRTMTAQMVYADSRKAEAAKAALLGYLSATAIHGDWPRDRLLAMSAPILVRVLELDQADEDNPRKLRDLVSRLNLSLTQALDPRRQAASAAARLSPEAIGRLAAAAPVDQAPSEWLRGPGGRAMLGELRAAGVITDRTAPSYVSSDGTLNDAGRTLALRTLAAAVLDDPDLLQWLPPSLLDETAAAAGAILAAAGYGRDVRPELRAAYKLRRALDATGLTLEDWLRQLPLPGEPLHVGPTTELERAVWAAVDKHRGARRFPGLWRRFAVMASTWPEGQTDLLGETRSTAELVRQAAARETNPLRVNVWDVATTEDGARTFSGPWPVPDRKAGAVAQEIGRELRADVVVLFWRDPLGTLVPVARYRVSDGRKLADARPLRLSNPAAPSPLPTRLVDPGRRADYERSVLAAARPEVAPVLRWLLEDGPAPSNLQWKAAREYVRGLAERSAPAYPWGMLAVSHADGDELHTVDAAGYELRLSKDTARWDPRQPIRLLNPASAPAPVEYFSRRLKYGQNPWRLWLEACLKDGEARQPAEVWAATRRLLEGHASGELGLWPWGEFAWVERRNGRKGKATLELVDANGYGILWTEEGVAALRGPAELLTLEGQAKPKAKAAAAREQAATLERQEVALRRKLEQPAPKGTPDVEAINRALLAGSRLLPVPESGWELPR